MKRIVLTLAMTVNLIACGQQELQGIQGAKGEQGVPGEPALLPIPPVPPTVDVVQEDINMLLADENDYRFGLGQAALTSGLSCSVQAISGGQWLSNSSPGYNGGQGVVVGTGLTYPYLYKGPFNQANVSSGVNNLLPTALQPLFVGLNLVIRCSGQLVVLDTDYYNFELSSDDGSILTIDGTQVVNNDGAHGMILKTGTKFLRRGVRSFNLVYAQSGSGNFGLILKASGTTIDPKYYAH